jgi:hypothetical protein
MDDPKPIGQCIDEAIAKLLGPSGDAYYSELVPQTQENRRRIEHEVRARFHEVFSEVFSELTGLHMDPWTLETAARTEANRRI